MRRRRGADPRTRSSPSPNNGFAFAASGLYVWETTAQEVAWARELAAFARALPHDRPR